VTDPSTRLTVVSAPPGYGKSVAVAGWVAQRAVPCAWLTLTGDANDPAGLGRPLLAVLEERAQHPRNLADRRDLP
jgi:LuxR family maltose regulon positive regulatory protein